MENEQQSQQEFPVSFSGTAGEYFRIWIVNLALTIATLGIYSAWAKVRRKRYFHSNTSIDGESFEYRGQPLAILKGRLIAVGVTALVYVASHYSFKLVLALIPVALFVLPWLLVRSYGFNAHNTVYRGVRFRFTGTYWKCWRLITGYGLLTIFTAGLGWFYFKTRMTEFIVRGHSYGATAFTVPDLKKEFFGFYGKMIGLGLLSGLALFAIGFAIASVSHAAVRPDSAAAYFINFVTYVFYLGIFAYIRSRILNSTFNNAALGEIRFRSTLGARELFALYAVNIIAIVCTIGLATPWAVIRTLRYRAGHLTVLAPGLDSLRASTESRDVSATGEEVGEMLDIDFSL